MIEHARQRFRLIVSRNAREPGMRLGPSRFTAAADEIEAEDAILARVEGPPGTDYFVPTAAARVGGLEQSPVAPDPPDGADQRGVRGPGQPPCNSSTGQLSPVMEYPGARNLENAFP